MGDTHKEFEERIKGIDEMVDVARIKYERKDRINRIMNSALVGLATVAFVIAVYNRLIKINDDSQNEFSMTLSESRRADSVLKVLVKYAKGLETEMLIPSDWVEFRDTNLNVKLALTNENFKKLQSEFTILRESLSPIDPDEVLKIARLTDELKLLRSDFDKLDENLLARHTEFTQFIAREKESSSKFMNIILVALIPFILTLGYNIFRDTRKKPKDFEQELEKLKEEIKNLSKS